MARILEEIVSWNGAHMEYLEIYRDRQLERRVPLDKKEFSIGREPSCDIHLDSDRVSRSHARLSQTPEGDWIIQDLDSFNHVYLNGAKIQEQRLSPTDQVRICGFHLRLTSETAANALLPPTPPPGAPGPLNWTVIEPTGRLAQLAPEALDRLQQFESSLLQATTSSELVECLCRECERLLAPRMLAVGAGQPPSYHWQVVRQGRPSQAELQRRLGRVDERLKRAPQEMANWDSVSDPLDSGDFPQARACLLLPLKGREGVIGHLYVENPAEGVSIEAALPYLKLACLHAGLVWENLELADMRAEHATMESQLRAARQIQLGLFPPSLELDPRLDAAAVNQPSASISGDYYDLIRIDAERFVFVMADAVGHGLPASLLMAGVRAALRTALEIGADWPALFRSLDRVVESSTDSAVFVTGLLGRLDLGRQELELVSAGHPLPLVLVDGQPLPISRDCTSRAWGMPFEVPWRVERLSLAGADWVILSYTDGITEAGAGTPQGTWGRTRLASCLDDHSREPAEAICRAILVEVAAHTGERRIDDDRTLMVLRKK